MEPTTILVTGAGGPAGVALVRALTAAGHSVLAVDADPLAAGLRLATRGMVVPTGDDPRFVDVLTDVAQRGAAKAVLGTVAEEIPALHEAAEGLEAIGARVWLPSVDAVARCIDRWTFAKIMLEAGVPSPACALATADGVPGPWVVRPRFGRAGGAELDVDDESELEWACRRVEEPLVQSRPSGRELTVDALVDRHGGLAGAVPSWRVRNGRGISTSARTFASKELRALTAEVLDAVGLVGPASVLGSSTPDGGFTITEVRPRFSSGLPLSQAAGAELVEEYVRGTLGLPVRSERLHFRTGVRTTRYSSDVIEG